MSFQLPTNFSLTSQIPLDNRIVVNNITERNALVTSGKAYAGIIVYVISDSTFYSYNGTTWSLLNNLNFIYVTAPSQFLPVAVTKNTRIGVDTLNSSVTITLPTSNLNLGDVIEIIDLNKTFHLRNLIITSTQHAIEGSSAGLTCNVQGANFNLIWVGGGTGWGISVIDNNFSKVGVLGQSSVIPLIFLNIPLGNNSELFDSNDVSNYKIPWNNVEYFNNQYVTINPPGSALIIDSTKYITYNPTTKNLYIREPGVYNVDLRFSSYNLTDSTDFLRARLRSWDSEIPGGLEQISPLLDVTLNSPPDGPTRPRVLAAFAQGPIGTTFNGEAMCAGFTTFRITTPQYIIADFLHVGALRILNVPNPPPPEPLGYPVFEGPFGNQPFMFISKIV